MRRWLDMMANRQLMRHVAVDAAMHGLATVADRLPSMQRRQATFRLIEAIPYAHHAGETLCLDVLQPKVPGPHPVLIYFHGGGFAIGSKCTHRALAAAYAAQGYLVCNVDYRLAPKHPFPAALEDACAAWLWATDQVAHYGGDSRCMTLAGESAGANLALSVTLADPLCVLEAMATAPDLPPLFIAAGLADPVAGDSQRLEQVLRRLRLPHTARYYPGETHAFHVMFWRAQALVCWRDSFEFLRRQAHPHLTDHPTHRESEPHAPG